MSVTAEYDEFFFAAGSTFPVALAEPVGKELIALREDQQRGLTARDVLLYAKTHPESAIAKCFDWDVRSAAEAHWINIAGSLLRSIRTRVIIANVSRPQSAPRIIETRLMQHVQPIGPMIDLDHKVYLPASETLTNPHYQAQQIEAALDELDRWRNVHAHRVELKLYLQKLDEADKAFGRDRDKARKDRKPAA